MTFSPTIEGNRIAGIFPFGTLCNFLEQVSRLSGIKKKKQIISSFIQKWSDKYNDITGNSGMIAAGLGSFYPVLRLLMPSADRERNAFGIGEPTMAKMLIKAFGLAPKGPDAMNLLKQCSSSMSNKIFNRDLADIVQRVLKDHCSTVCTDTITKIHEILDDLADTVTQDGKFEIISRFVRTATVLELKWFVRIVSRRDLSLGIGDKVILNCLHPSAVSVWDVTQNLFTVCQHIAGIDPKVLLSEGDASKLIKVGLFTPFKPMLCARASSADEICSAYLQQFVGSLESGLCLEVKYDGERVQVHKCGSNYRFWSRSGREWTVSYGGSGDINNGTLTHRLHGNGSTFASHVNDCILDGEMLAFDIRKNRFVTKAMGYDVKRARFEDQSGESKDILPCYIAFDILYLNGELLTEQSLSERKRTLFSIFSSTKLTCEEVSSIVENCFNPIDRGDSGMDVDEDEQIQQDQLLSLFTIVKGALYLGGFIVTKPDKTRLACYFDSWVQHGAEGLVAKALCSPYVPNGRNRVGWWKLKPDYVSGLCTDIDCLIVGAYNTNTHGNFTAAATRHTRFLSFLCAVTDDEDDKEVNKRAKMQSDDDLEIPKFLTFCQVTNGLKREQLESINRRLEEHWRPYNRRKINCGETEWLCVKGERPDFWVPPRHSLVLQIHAAEMTASASYSAGYTLRFPRVSAIREDKNWRTVASVSEIKMLYHETKGKMVTKKSETLSEEESDDNVADINDDNASLSEDTSGFASTSSTPIKPAKKRPKPPISMYSSLDKEAVEIESVAFKDLEFCLYISSRFTGPSSDLATKNDLEKSILKMSGKVVQNPGTKTDYVVADVVTIRVSNLIEATLKATARGREGGYDIISTEWLIRCIEEKRLLPPRKREVFASRLLTKLEIE
ncbi:hypothetical protein Aperf_G00000099576 [Anoplocephala perfoliata]